MVNKACLIVIDGWGVNAKAGTKGDAIYDAPTPVMDELEKEQAYTTLAAHGRAVGLPAGLMGNSEVGHLNIGAGRVVYQDIVRIDVALEEKKFGTIKAIEDSFERAKAGNGRLHFCGLVSDGGVHGHIKHLIGLLEAAKEAGVPESYVHFYADGRDTSPRSTTKYLKELLQAMEALQYGKLATIVGRYYAMDRDKRWERVQIAFDAMTQGVGEKSDDAVKTVEERYAKDETDEFLKPIIVDGEGLVKDNDTMFFFDFRSDRMREITQAFGIKPTPFDSRVPNDLHIATMTQYKAEFPFPAAFPPQKMTDVLGEWLAKKDVAQVHIAETEKYAHVTFFFNGGTEAQFAGEDRDLVPSPRVATYDMEPAMSSWAVAEKVAEEIGADKHPFVMCNFAPPDMVGHTGDYDAAVQAIDATDKAIGRIYEACKEHGYALFVTADHGNAEKMLSDDGSTPHTAHTCSRVPFVMASEGKHAFVAADEKHALCDVAPTVLAYMGIDIPEHMTGHSLLA
ncbi:hypothetical protein LPJ77_003436 [Coemansia sp. RSA 2523]|nr:hypothetical protein LPJ69_001877 [Coemansia sp. RSA 1752]KAJ1776078.1 hypothetical protein LPJ54_003308 [Coemansia sp. RSA 1824]KAJ1786536.1 hypothetical protein LPJ62_003756 [Coemansia sp. RSA 2167]KAJ1791419.1 hypothetical protein LPJ67_001861 [Coemansia sp. RSA 1938]KAJ1806744.1 hypothetical protein LPJ77_003436 [Coemansia sp. RSA 2523]KAJ2147486.1 hypothetical protein IW142_001605 [Coemansia sp. RSA 564]KAJ2409602.1 hypothetical protein J3F80_001198 [Coemansia sp. RSA 2526]KAJ2576270